MTSYLTHFSDESYGSSQGIEAAMASGEWWSS